MSNDYNKIRKEFSVILNTYTPLSDSPEDQVSSAVSILKAVMKSDSLMKSDFKVLFWKNGDDKSDKLSYIVKGQEIIALLQDYKEYSFSFDLADLN